MRSARPGQGREITSARSQKDAASFWYLSSRMVRGVAMTSTAEPLPPWAAGFTAGSMPMMGSSGWVWRSRTMVELVAVLRATTRAFTPCFSSRSAAAMDSARTSSRDRSP